MVIKRSRSFVEFRKEEIQQSIPSRFAQQVRRFPHHIAVQTRAAQITYEELDRFSNRIAHVVLEKCGAKTAPIALLFEPGPSMVAAILGVLKSGRFFLPLDPASPRRRSALRRMSANGSHALPQTAPRCWICDANETIVDAICVDVFNASRRKICENRRGN